MQYNIRQLLSKQGLGISWSPWDPFRGLWPENNFHNNTKTLFLLSTSLQCYSVQATECEISQRLNARAVERIQLSSIKLETNSGFLTLLCIGKTWKSLKKYQGQALTSFWFKLVYGGMWWAREGNRFIKVFQVIWMCSKVKWRFVFQWI